MGFDFRDKRIALRLREMAREPMDPHRIDELPEATKIWVVKTPSEGIDGKSGDTHYGADCQVYVPNESGGEVTFSLYADADGDNVTLKVYNMSTDPVSGDALIQVVECFGILFANWEDCA